jgi:Aldehyde:ferredoxin oxidoreductase
MFGPFSEAGTSAMAEALNPMGTFPTRNFTEGSLVGWEAVGGSAYAVLKVRNTTCHGCVIHCGNVFRVKDGPHTGAESEGPEYETINMFSGMTGCTDIATTVVADKLCDDLGMDTMSAGVTIGFAMEMYEKGLLTKADTGGLELNFGNSEAVLALLQQIGERSGFGDILAEGVKRAAEKLGGDAPKYAMHVKGLEMPAYEPRAAKWQGLGFVTSPMGANHNIGYHTQEIFNVPFPRAVDRSAESGFADVTKWNQDTTAMWETGIVCVFPAMLGMFSPTLFAELMAETTGVEELGSVEYLLQVGERIFNLERLYNLRAGFMRGDDSYPRRMVTEPLANGGTSTGQVIKNLDGMLDEYYAVRGWTRESVPTRAKLEELGLLSMVGDELAG